MALTRNTSPEVFDNSGKFNVTTSLTEGASYQNLRIRADLYYKGVVLATIEQPKGLDDWDFGGILRRLCSHWRPPLNSTSVSLLPKINSYTNKITGWTNDGVDPFSVHTTVGARFTQLEKTPAGAAKTASNNISVVAGRYYAFCIYDYDLTSGEHLTVTFDDGTASGWDNNVIVLNAEYGIYLFMCRTTTATGKIYLENQAGDTVVINEVRCYCLEIDPETDDYFGFSAPYTVQFTEVYEDVSDVTTEGATEDTEVFSFFNVRGVLDDYVCDGTAKKLLISALDDEWPYFGGNRDITIDAELHIIGITKKYYQGLAYETSGNPGVWAHGDYAYPALGYFAVILHRGHGAFAATPLVSYAHIRMYDEDGYLGGNAITREYYIPTVSRIVDTSKHLHLCWNNYIGGIQQWTFLAGFDESKFGVRDLYKDNEGRNKVFSSVRGTRQILHSHYISDAQAKALAECVASEDAYLVDDTNAERNEVFIVPDSLVAVKNGDLSSISIEIEIIHPEDWS